MFSDVKYYASIEWDKIHKKSNLEKLDYIIILVTFKT